MSWRRVVDLRALNTLAVSASADWYYRVENLEQLAEALQLKQTRDLPMMVLGGGSNIVLSADFPGLVLHMAIPGIDVQQQAENIHLRVGAGENWDQLVRYCLSQGWYGLENLIAIPGSVGAAPIQNIGAYGVELSSVLQSVEGWQLDSGYRQLSRDQCELSYRDSIFKHALRDRFIITHVNLVLSTRPELHIDYPALREALAAEGDMSPQEVARAVATIRGSKLPDPAVLPNVGSFFKNPVIPASQCAQLQSRFPALPAWPMNNEHCKIAAGWLVEAAGWKGLRRDGVGVHDLQALVLINYAGRPGADVLALAEQIRDDVQQRFAVRLEIEPRVY